jgi:hypothetical protein
VRLFVWVVIAAASLAGCLAEPSDGEPDASAPAPSIRDLAYAAVSTAEVLDVWLHGGPLPTSSVLVGSPEDLPASRAQVRDRHLSFHEDRDNLFSTLSGDAHLVRSPSDADDCDEVTVSPSRNLVQLVNRISHVETSDRRREATKYRARN